MPRSDDQSTASAKNEIRYTADFVWSESPTEDLSVPGEKTVSLSACPSGVKGDQPEYWIYISGKGTAEAVRVEGGTCKGDGRAGTLEFTTTHAHPSGDPLGSASDGLQEASIAASFQPANPTAPAQAGRVMVTPGTELRLYARVSIRALNQVVDFSGAIFECYMAMAQYVRLRWGPQALQSLQQHHSSESARTSHGGREHEADDRNQCAVDADHQCLSAGTRQTTAPSERMCRSTTIRLSCSMGWIVPRAASVAIPISAVPMSRRPVLSTSVPPWAG